MDVRVGKKESKGADKKRGRLLRRVKRVCARTPKPDLRGRSARHTRPILATFPERSTLRGHIVPARIGKLVFSTLIPLEKVSSVDFSAPWFSEVAFWVRSTDSGVSTVSVAVCRRGWANLHKIQTATRRQIVWYGPAQTDFDPKKCQPGRSTRMVVC